MGEKLTSKRTITKKMMLVNKRKSLLNNGAIKVIIYEVLINPKGENMAC